MLQEKKNIERTTKHKEAGVDAGFEVGKMLPVLCKKFSQ